MRLLLAFDSFKGSLASPEVGEAFAAAWHALSPSDDIRLLSIADGGEGTVDAVVESCGGEYRSIMAHDPLGRSITARYGVVDVDGQRSAVVECASASGLTLIPAEERDAERATSYGTGEVIADAMAYGCRRIYVGLGGSATTDGGMGMLRALGYKFYDADGNELSGRGNDLINVSRIDASCRNRLLSDVEFIVATDVDNPLYGADGAAYIFAPQKGADTAAVQRLDAGLRHYAEVVAEVVGGDLATSCGAGAAGGMGFALMAMVGAKRCRGIDMVLDIEQFDDYATQSDLIITGEGSLDSQTLRGKAPYGVLQRAMRHGVKAIAIGGRVEDHDVLLAAGFDALYTITPEGMPLREAMRSDVAKENVRRIASHIHSQYRS